MISTIDDEEAATLSFKKEQDMAMWSVQLALHVLNLLTARNVATVRVPPPSALSKRHQQRGGIPLVSWRELVIDLTRTPGGRTEGLPAGADPRARPLHLVRGHFADHTKHGLFGKENLKGKFWIPAMVRGTPEAGAVVKSYRVKFNPQ
jgi:hypothetical protein